MASSSLQGFEVSFAKTNFDLCVLCQTKKVGLNGTDVGRNNIVTASNKYQDKLFDDVGKDDLSSFKYHMKCYRSYVRHFDHVGDISNNENNSTTDEDLIRIISHQRTFLPPVVVSNMHVTASDLVDIVTEVVVNFMIVMVKFLAAILITETNEIYECLKNTYRDLYMILRTMC